MLKIRTCVVVFTLLASAASQTVRESEVKPEYLDTFTDLSWSYLLNRNRTTWPLQAGYSGLGIQNLNEYILSSVFKLLD